VDRALEEYRFDRAADLLYHFVWHQFCDWYIELVKPDFQVDADQGTPAAARVETVRSVLLQVLGTLLRLLHPMIPFITEELWHKLPQEESFIARAPWPRCDESLIDAAAERDVDLLKEAAIKIRNLRAEHNIDASRRIEVLLSAEDGAVAEMFRAQSGLIKALVRAESIQVVGAIGTPIAARGTIPGVQMAVPLEGLLDLEAERARLRKELDKVEGELQRRSRKLNNPSFLERAPEEVVEKERRLHQELVERHGRLEQHLTTLG